MTFEAQSPESISTNVDLIEICWPVARLIQSQSVRGSFYVTYADPGILQKIEDQTGLKFQAQFLFSSNHYHLLAT